MPSSIPCRRCRADLARGHARAGRFDPLRLRRLLARHHRCEDGRPVQLVFFSDLTNLEVGTRQTLAANATSFDMYGAGTGGLLPPGYALTVKVRLVDVFNDSLPPDVGKVHRASHAIVNYTTPMAAAIPEPETYALMPAGLGLLGFVLRRRKPR